MIDTAIDNMLPDGLINFDKRRKEFEIIAQIKLLQGAANAYQIETQEHFIRWFESVLLLDERQAFELSCQIEPQANNNSAKDNKYKRKAAIVHSPNGNYHKKNDSIASTASSSSGSQLYETESSVPSIMENNNSKEGEEEVNNDEPDGEDTFETSHNKTDIARRGSRGSFLSSVSSSCGSCSLDASLASSSNAPR